MSSATIPEMNQKLEELSQFFKSKTIHFENKIHQHEGKFTEADNRDFENLLEQIKNDAIQKITCFFDEKLNNNCRTYDTEVSQYCSAASSVESDLLAFREDLERATIEMKEEQFRKQNLMEHFSKKYRENTMLKKCVRILRKNQEERMQARMKDQRMDNVYHKNLKKKAFFPWRTLSYKDGYANTVRTEAEKDIMNIHEQYQAIIDILKEKITDTNDIIKVKKTAKGEFAYALSKNLLKSISNLSLEMMSLNQMALRDGECDEEQTHKFMSQIDTVIKEKLTKVKQYRRGLVATTESMQDEQGEKKRKHITFI